MQRNEPERRDPREAVDEDAKNMEKAEHAPSFLTARELQVRQPAKGEDRAKPAGDEKPRRDPGRKGSGD